MFCDLVNIFRSGKDLDKESAAALVRFFTNPESSQTDIAILTAAWKSKGCKSEELFYIASYILENELERINFEGKIIDCCGIGGDNSGTFNISTSSAFVLASMGINVAKHGGRKTSSLSGSMDFLEALGIKTFSETELIKKRLEETGLAFIGSPALHKVLGRWKSICKELEFTGQTGLIGTLTNPVCISHQLIGVPKLELGEIMINALKMLGRKRAAVIFGKPRLDEISVCGNTTVWELKNNEISHYEINPEDFGIEIYSLEALRGNTPEYNAKIFNDLIHNKATKAITDCVALNAGFSAYLYDYSQSVKDGFIQAKASIENGNVKNFFENYIRNQ